MNGSVIGTRGQKPRRAIKTARGMKTHSPSTTHRLRNAEGVTTARDTISVLKDQGQKHSKATCVMRIFQNIFGHRATSSSMTATPTPVFGWRNTTLRVG
jgi:hypothetical protein